MIVNNVIMEDLKWSFVLLKVVFLFVVVENGVIVIIYGLLDIVVVSFMIML